MSASERNKCNKGNVLTLSPSLKVQLEREPRDFPTLRFKREITDIDDFTYDDFVVEGYKPMGKIEMKMSVRAIKTRPSQLLRFS